MSPTSPKNSASRCIEFDEEELRPYFELERVVAGMFEIFSQLLGIKVIEQPGVPGWDAAVKYFQVEDAENGTHLGGFYTDWFPRENKRGGAWMDSLFTGNPAAGQPHVGLICGNLTPPVAGKPSLLTHREVETIFHEFGHLLHHTLEPGSGQIAGGHQRPLGFRRAAFADHGELVHGARSAEQVRAAIIKPASPFRKSCFKK